VIIIVYASEGENMWSKLLEKVKERNLFGHTMVMYYLMRNLGKEKGDDELD